MSRTDRTVTVLGLVACLGLLAACGSSEPTRDDLPSDITSARPSITQQEAQFVLAANKRGADVTGATVTDDIESGKAVCWALDHGGIDLREMVSGLTPAEAPRTIAIMAAAVPAFCPDNDHQLDQLSLPS